MKNEIGKKIKEVRDIKGLSQYAVGKKAGIQQVIVRHIEAGETAYSIDSLVKTCDVFGLKIEVVSKLLTKDQNE